MWNINIPLSVDLNNLQDQDTSEGESPVTILPLPPKYYENKFLDKIHVVGSFKVKGELSYYLMPFFKIKLKCKTNRFSYETIVIGDECDEEDDARENAFRKAYKVIMDKYRRDFDEYEKIQRRKKLTANMAPKKIVVDESVAPKTLQPEAEYEEKFRAIIKPVGFFTIKSDLTQQSKPFYKIWFRCKTDTFAYETTVVGGEFDDENEAREEAFRKAYWVLQNQFRIEEENSTRGGYSSKKAPIPAPIQEKGSYNLQSTETNPMNKVFESKLKSMMKSLDGTFQLEPHVTDPQSPSFKLNLQCKTDTMKYDAIVVGYKKQSEIDTTEILFQQVKKYFNERKKENVSVSALENRSSRKYFEGHFTSFISELGTFTVESQPSYFKIHMQCCKGGVTLETTVNGDKFDDEEFARQNAFRKAYYILKKEFPADWLEYQMRLRQYENSNRE